MMTKGCFKSVFMTLQFAQRGSFTGDATCFYVLAQDFPGLFAGNAADVFFGHFSPFA